MQTQKLHSTIEKSSLLTPEEKNHYLNILPLLTEDQQMQLFLMLSGGEEISNTIIADQNRRINKERKKFLTDFEKNSKKMLKDAVVQYETSAKTASEEEILNKLSNL